MDTAVSAPTATGAPSSEQLARARAGDDEAFRRLVEPHRRELQVHCYRILGSLQDAEDVLQETLLTAWRSLDQFQQRASLRTWLYRIATSRCLNALRSRRRRPQATTPLPDVRPPEATRLGEVLWLQPYPDLLLEDLPDRAPGPEARYEATEAISLAFVAALQLLPPRQRAVLVLRDVLGYPASEVAGILDTTESSVTSALKRARATLQREHAAAPDREPPPPPSSPAEAAVLTRLARALEAADVDGVVTLLTDDVWLTMPPIPLEYQGRELATEFYTTVVFRPGRRYKAVPTRANGQPALGIYVPDPHGTLHANGLMVLTLAGDRISAVTRFDPSVLPAFGLPRTLPETADG